MNVQLNYKVKIIHRLQPGGLINELRAGIFDSKDEIEKMIKNVLKPKGLFKESGLLGFGFIIPGHGVRGKQHPIDSDADVKSMYEFYLLL